MEKVLVITGGSRGIGLATAKQFSAEGYRVVNLSRQQPELDGVQHLAVDLCDINWPQQHGDALTDLVKGADQITLIHNAGVITNDSIHDVQAESFHKVMQLNVIAASQLNQLLLPLMTAGSSILYVSSTLGEKGIANTCSYVSSKHAQIGLMKAGCQDLFGSGIHTAAICPGFTDTKMLHDLVDDDAEVLAYFSSLSSFNRMLEPEEIANTLWFCANTPAINGSVIHANLGQVEN